MVGFHALARGLLLSCAVLTGPRPARAAPAAEQPWHAEAPKVMQDLRAGRPLVVEVKVALCNNAQIDCGATWAGQPARPATNLYWGAIFGARRFLERKNSGWARVSLEQGPAPVLERAVFRRSIASTAFGLQGGTLEQIVVLEAYHGAHIAQALRDFALRAQSGGTVEYIDADVTREVPVHVAAYVGHNGLMDGLTLPPVAASNRAVPAFVLACASEPYFTGWLREVGSRPLVMTRALMAPEGYVLAAILDGLASSEPSRGLRRRAVAAYARWQRSSEKDAGRVFAPR